MHVWDIKGYGRALNCKTNSERKTEFLRATGRGFMSSRRLGIGNNRNKQSVITWWFGGL